MVDLFQKDACNIDKILVFVNAKQYKGILKRMQTQKLRKPHKKKFTMTPSKVNNISSKVSQTNVEQIEIIKDLKSNLNKAQVFTANKEDIKVNNHDKKDIYSPTSTPLMWSYELYVKEPMSMKRRLKILEDKTKFLSSRENQREKIKLLRRKSQTCRCGLIILKHEGVMVIINEKWCGIVKVEKEDPNKQYIWMQIIEKEVTFRLYGCYFSQKNSNIYKRSNLDNKYMYTSLKRDISLFSSLQ